jgi:hypothetical protein
MEKRLAWLGNAGSERESGRERECLERRFSLVKSDRRNKMDSRFSAVSFLSVLFRSLLFFIQISFQPSSFLLGHFRRGSLMLLYEGAL